MALDLQPPRSENLDRPIDDRLGGQLIDVNVAAIHEILRTLAIFSLELIREAHRGLFESRVLNQAQMRSRCFLLHSSSSSKGACASGSAGAVLACAGGFVLCRTFLRDRIVGC